MIVVPAVIPVPEPPASDVAWSELLEKDSGPYLQMSNVIFIRDWHALLSMAETKCAVWRRDSVPVGLRERG